MLLRYALRRSLLALPLLLGISLLTFGMLQLTPGGPVRVEVGMNPRMSPESVAELKKLYGLDQPLHQQYLSWLSRLARFDLGTSFRDQRRVVDKVRDALPATLILNLMSLLIAYGLGVPLGLYSAVKQGSLGERLASHATFFAWSFPAFWLALLLQLLLAVQWGLFPVSGFRSLSFSEQSWLTAAPDIAWHLVLPLIASTFGAWAVISRYLRNSMLEVLRQDYIRTARAKGLSERDVLLRHALPNALLPMITLLGMSIPGLLGASVIIETIFAWPGMGRLAYEASTGFDYPVVMGLTWMAALLTIFGNLAADLAYAALDPRIKY